MPARACEFCGKLHCRASKGGRVCGQRISSLCWFGRGVLGFSGFGVLLHVSESGLRLEGLGLGSVLHGCMAPSNMRGFPAALLARNMRESRSPRASTTRPRTGVRRTTRATISLKGKSGIEPPVANLARIVVLTLHCNQEF